MTINVFVKSAAAHVQSSAMLRVAGLKSAGSKRFQDYECTLLVLVCQDDKVLLNHKPVKLKAKGQGILQVSAEAVWNVDGERPQGFDVEVM